MGRLVNIGEIRDGRKASNAATSRSDDNVSRGSGASPNRKSTGLVSIGELRKSNIVNTPPIPTVNSVTQADRNESGINNTNATLDTSDTRSSENNGTEQEAPTRRTSPSNKDFLEPPLTSKVPVQDSEVDEEKGLNSHTVSTDVPTLKPVSPTGTSKVVTSTRLVNIADLLSQETKRHQRRKKDVESKQALSLLERLGGKSIVNLAVNELYTRLVEDVRLKDFFDGVPMEDFLKVHQVNFITVALTNIPEDFNVEDKLLKGHERLFQMGLTEFHFDIFVWHLTATLREAQIERTMVQEVIAAVSPLRKIFREGAGKRDKPKAKGRSPDEGVVKSERPPPRKPVKNETANNEEQSSSHEDAEELKSGDGSSNTSTSVVVSSKSKKHRLAMAPALPPGSPGVVGASPSPSPRVTNSADKERVSSNNDVRVDKRVNTLSTTSSRNSETPDKSRSGHEGRQTNALSHSHNEQSKLAAAVNENGSNASAALVSDHAKLNTDESSEQLPRDIPTEVVTTNEQQSTGGLLQKLRMNSINRRFRQDPPADIEAPHEIQTRRSQPGAFRLRPSSLEERQLAAVSFVHQEQASHPDLSPSNSPRNSASNIRVPSLVQAVLVDDPRGNSNNNRLGAVDLEAVHISTVHAEPVKCLNNKHLCFYFAVMVLIVGITSYATRLL